MHRTTVLLAGTLLLPVLAMAGSPTSATAPQKQAAPPAPSVKDVRAAYGSAPVRVQPRQGVAVAFRARKGDRVFLDVTNGRDDEAPCFGHQTLRDGRGSRSSAVDGVRSARVVTVRTTGRVVLTFRGYCAANKGQKADPAAVQLTKVRMRDVGRDDRTTVRAPRRGFVDIAYVTVRRHGRDTLTLRADDGTVQYDWGGRLLLGSRLSFSDDAASVSVEAGHRAAQPHSSIYVPPTRLRPGQRIGLVVAGRGYAESLRARVHRTTLDGPAIPLQADPGREDVLVYAATPADRLYVTATGLQADPDHLVHPIWDPWRTYSGGADRRDPSLRRTIVASDLDGAGPQQLQVRVRRTVRTADLVVDGPPVTFASVEPGTRFVASIPATDAGAVLLRATDESVTGPWDTYVPSTVCNRGKCLDTGLDVSTDVPIRRGSLQPGEVHELQLTYAPDASGSVTLQLTRTP